jgi:DNA (cytosine-5)-methyltransferase 1
VSLLPTPRDTDGTKGGPNQRGSSGDHSPAEFAAQYDGTWGDYAAAIARWEALTRPAPPPTQPSKKGTPQLSPAFAEWMMGLPAGWITDVPGVTRNEALRLAGNGVVPTQAAAALRIMLNRAEAAA